MSAACRSICRSSPRCGRSDLDEFRDPDEQSQVVGVAGCTRSRAAVFVHLRYRRIPQRLSVFSRPSTSGREQRSVDGSQRSNPRSQCLPALRNEGLNPMSNDAGSGIGQLTNQAIEDVNRSSMEQTKKDLARSDNSQCRAIEAEFLQGNNPMKSAPALACNRLNVENGNPLLNIIYSLNLLNLKQKSLDKNTFEDTHYKQKFNLNAQDMAKIKEAVLTWAYNAGQTVGTPVKIILDDLYADKQVTDVNLFLKQVEQSIFSYKRAKNIKKGRKNPNAMAHINSRYYTEVNKSFDLIDKNLEGGKCLLNH